MAKKSKGPSKSAAIRELVDANSSASPKELAAMLADKGINVTAGFVSTIKSNYLRKQRGGGKKRGRKPGVASSSGGLSIETLLMAKNLAAKMGGVAEAKLALDALAKLM